jgi:hypothetical protein
MLHRQVQEVGAADWSAFRERLYPGLVAERLVIDHEEAPLDAAALPGAVAVIRPRELHLLSYPYERRCSRWSCSGGR